MRAGVGRCWSVRPGLVGGIVLWSYLTAMVMITIPHSAHGQEPPDSTTASTPSNNNPRSPSEAGADRPATDPDVTPESDPAEEAPPPPKQLNAVRIPGGIRLDGQLDEDAWSTATFHSDFQQKGQDRGFPPRVRTEVAFVYDDTFLYVGARMEQEEEGGGSRTFGRRDDPGNADRILVSLDTYRDRRTAYTFGVTVSGVRIDHVSSRDSESWTDSSFDPIWQARVTSDSTGWTAELRIPFTQLRFSPGSEQVWGVNVRRWHPETYLNTYWVVVPYYESGWASRFGVIRGLSNVNGGAGVEILPYALGQASYDRSPFGNPSPDETRVRYGGNLKMGLGSSMTLDAAVMPDFGQVEADPARVNLSAFETFFPERRPFFTEGGELFRVRGPNYFYSRRIGSVPAGAVPRSVFEQVQSATFLGGAKLTGRLPRGLSVGSLVALTDRERVRVPVDTTGVTRSIVAAPRTAFSVGRLQQEVGSGGSNVGLMVTGVERFFDGDDRLPDLLGRRALAGGLDWTVLFGDGVFEVTGHSGASWVEGSSDAIHRLQTSNGHYFQRPDAGHVSVDLGATELLGWSGGLSVAKIGGAHWFWSAGVDASSPGFEIRDAGSQRRADRIDAHTSLTYRTRDGSGGVRDRSLTLSAAGGWNFGRVRRHTSISGAGAVTWGNLWTTTVDGGVNFPALSDDLTRGGPLMATPTSGWLNLGLYSARSASWSWNLGAGSFLDAHGGWSGSVNAGSRLQAAEWVEFDLRAGATLARETRQFVTARSGGSSETYGGRYIFSDLSRREVFLRFRTKVAFAPDAVLTLYAEPFVASGRFHDFGELTAAGSSSLLRYGTGGTTIERTGNGSWLVTDEGDEFGVPNHDFWVRSFRSTAVFQWEWRRGSSLYLIWQRSLSSFEDRVRSLQASTFLQSVEDSGENTFVVKASVLLGLY